MQSVTVNLAEALARRGHEVRVHTLTDVSLEHNGVAWHKMESAAHRSDVVIVNNVIALFKKSACKNRILWSHNPITASKIWKNNLLFQSFRYPAHAVFLSLSQSNTAPSVLPFKTRRIIEHGMPEMFRRHSLAASAPPPRALFTSQPYRGLQWTLDLWRDSIHPVMPHAELHVFSPKGETSIARMSGYENAGVVLRGGLPQSELVAELQAARVLLCPGHRHETYCNAAAEATASGLPIVTRGLGSLSERVRDGETGFIALQAEEFAKRTLQLLQDDALWLACHARALSDPSLKSWDARAEEWERAFF
jgi:glycosyltransferase involved in cell wall biosynthesis